MRAYEGMDEASDVNDDMYGVNNQVPYWVTTEKMSPIYLTREDILELGFLRSHPERRIYQHKDKPTLLMEQYTYKDYSVKDLAVEAIKIYYNTPMIVVLYNSVKPNKEDIQLIIDNYAG